MRAAVVTRWTPSLLAAAVAVGGCGSCQKGPPAELRVDGETPYVRCLARDAPEERQWSVGRLRLSIEGRTLSVEGAARPLRIVAFAGPGPSDASLQDVMAAVRREDPALVLLVGDIGDSDGTARRTLEALASLERPVLVVAGARDDAVVWRKGFESLSGEARNRVIDVTTLRRVIAGDDELVPLAGAPGGHYARTTTACGFGEDDVLDVKGHLERGDGGRRRWLLAWGGPSGVGLTGLAGMDAGDPVIAELVANAGLHGGIVAWPRTAVGRQSRWVVVPPIVGPIVEAFDGRRIAPGPAVVTLAEEGLVLREQ